MLNSPTWVIQVVIFLSVENSNATCDTIDKLCYPVGQRWSWYVYDKAFLSCFILPYQYFDVISSSEARTTEDIRE